LLIITGIKCEVKWAFALDPEKSIGLKKQHDGGYMYKFCFGAYVTLQQAYLFLCSRYLPERNKNADEILPA
jgi:hypothetical protein